MIDSIRNAIAITVDRTAIGVDARAHRRDRTAVVDIGNAVFIGIRKIRTTARVDRLPRPGQVAISQRQREILGQAHAALCEAAVLSDILLVGELLRQARHAMDAMLGNVATEDMLDTLFGRFCIGK